VFNGGQGSEANVAGRGQGSEADVAETGPQDPGSGSEVSFTEGRVAKRTWPRLFGKIRDQDLTCLLLRGG